MEASRRSSEAVTSLKLEEDEDEAILLAAVRCCQASPLEAESRYVANHLLGFARKRQSPRNMAAAASSEWTPSSWRAKEVAQPVEYTGEAAAGKLPQVLDKLRHLPPIVTQHEVGGRARSMFDIVTYSYMPVFADRKATDSAVRDPFKFHRTTYPKTVNLRHGANTQRRRSK